MPQQPDGRASGNSPWPSHHPGAPPQPGALDGAARIPVPPVNFFLRAPLCGKPAQPSAPPEDGSPAPLVGIARLAAGALLEQSRNQVEYFRLPIRSLLNRVESSRVGFQWSINPYRGCEFGCHYCYARYTHTYMELEPTAFENKIYIKQDAARILRRDLASKKVLGTHITIGAATDPYQPAEKQFGVTRAVLETLLDFARTLPEGERFTLSITTKSNLILRDLELLRELSRAVTLHVNVSLATLNSRLARALEPRAPRPDLRLETVRQLNQAGIQTGIFLCPVLPGITDSPGDLEAAASAAASVNARWLMTNVVFLMQSSRQAFFPFLERSFPRLLRRYRIWFRRNGYAPDRYRQQISVTMRRLREKYRLAPGHPEAPLPALKRNAPLANPFPASQLAIPFAS